MHSMGNYRKNTYFFIGMRIFLYIGCEVRLSLSQYFFSLKVLYINKQQLIV